MAESRKSKAFSLFSQGCVPSSPEIKALKLHSSTRYKYFNEWQNRGNPEKTRDAGAAPTVSSITPGGEKIGAVDETRRKPLAPKAIEAEPEGRQETTDQGEEGEDSQVEEELWPEDIPAEERARAAREQQEAKEVVGVVSEVLTPKTKDGKAVEQERRIATTVAEEGIKCTVLLSLQTLTLYSIAKSTQAQLSQNGDGELTIGDFLDTCAEDFFRVRGKKLGLINYGGKK